ncbi:MAG: DUF4910 domain-containing protein [Candidatus Omnitrophica bacterium]|nr:DUF4910 domain-containing protein [Candidatus Omnitrophota bacterium]
MSKRFEEIKELIRTIAPLNRYNVSPGMDKALEMLKKLVPDTNIHRFPTHQKVWDWEIPQKWNLRSASLYADDKVICTHRDTPVRVWSGSVPVKRTMTYDELLKHVHYDKDEPGMIPWKYIYYNHTEESFGFSLTWQEFQALDPKATYRIEIDSQFYDDALTMGTLLLEGTSEDIIIISSDICHPGQANDSLSGVAAALMVYEKLCQLPNRHYSYLFTFQPETIGTIAFLANNEDLIPKIQYGIFSEMLGTPGRMVLQKSFQENTRIDMAAYEALMDFYNGEIEVKKFFNNCIVNDERILCQTGVEIPTIALNRGSFPAYHTDHDVYELLNFDLIAEAAEIVYRILGKMEQGRYHATPYERRPPRCCLANRYQKKLINEKLRADYPNMDDFVPVPKFKGPVFLSKRNLYIDITKQPLLSNAVDRMMISINGNNYCSDIASYCGVDYGFIYEYMMKFYEHDLISIQPLP